MISKVSATLPNKVFEVTPVVPLRMRFNKVVTEVFGGISGHSEWPTWLSTFMIPVSTYHLSFQSFKAKGVVVNLLLPPLLSFFIFGMHSLMSDFNNTFLYRAPVPVSSSNYDSSTSNPLVDFQTGDVLYSIWSLITLWRVLVTVLVIGNLKNIPFIWTLRIVNAFRFCTKTMRPKTPPTSAQLFQPIITTSRAPLMEIDFNMHKTNSSYFSDVDIARTHLVCTLFSEGIEHMRGGTSGYNGPSRPLFGLALGAVSCSFKRELKPYECYEMWTRILSWDEKWIYIVTHFVRKGAVRPKEYTLYPEQNSNGEGKGRKKQAGESMKGMECNPAVVATSLSKCVFKSGRRTVSPAMMMKYSGLLPVQSLSDALAHETDPVALSSCSSSDSGVDMGEEVESSDMAKIEKERQRGMRAATTLTANGQTALEMEFTAESEALGIHTDGCGITGVFSTLAQLAHLKRDKIL